MARPSVSSILLASTDPERLRTWYAGALDPADNTDIDGHRILKFGGFYLLIDTRADVGAKKPEPRREILNFDVYDAGADVGRLNEMCPPSVADHAGTLS